MTDQQDRLERLEASLCKTMAGFLGGLRSTCETKGNDEMTTRKEVFETQADWGPMDVVRHALVNISAYSTDPGARATADDAINAICTINAPLSASAEPVEALVYVPGLLDQTCPPKIWLQIDTMGDNDDRSEAVPEIAWGDLSWCYESIGGQEVVYVRADLVCPQPASCNPTTPETRT